MNFVLVKLGSDGQPDWSTVQIAATLIDAKVAARTLGLGRILVFRLAAEVIATCVIEFTEVARVV